ncbi:MAG TPA: hypothetical protein ENJ50_04190, partial [Planctomycetaceae bacterium]|nr:hypothetical protein [Planctomycetaceae bacterium]
MSISSRFRHFVTFPLVFVFGLAWLPASVAGQEIGFMEDFALASDRAKVLQKLVPGTPDFYFFHCLHYQQTEQFDKAQSMLDEWSRKLGQDARWKMMRHRQALLTYDRTPQNSLKYLREQLHLTFSHQAATHAGPASDLPSTLDPKLIDRELIARKLLANPNHLQGFSERALYWLASKSLSPAQRRQLLSRLQRPDVPGLVDLIVADFRSNRPVQFGQLKIHRLLTLEQLDALRKKIPELDANAVFVQSYIQRLAPSADDPADSPDVQRAHLQRLWQFAATLPDVHNSLKVHILYHRLRLDMSLNQFDKQRFMTYLKLPRQVRYINPVYLREPSRRRSIANLRADFRAATHFPVIADDEPLVRKYLEHFFVEETDFKAYLPYVRETFLKRVFAETKVLHGLGDPKEWAGMLPPAVYAELKKRVELEFAPHHSPVEFGSGDTVALDL